MKKTKMAAPTPIADDGKSQTVDLLSPFGRYLPSNVQRYAISAAPVLGLDRGVWRHSVAKLIFCGDPLDVTFRECNFRLFPSGNAVDAGILLRPRYNAEDIDFLLSHLPTGGTFLDIGSNVGLFSLPLSQKAGVVISVDANPEMVKRLSWNANASEVANITLVESAVSDRDGFGVMDMSHRDAGQAHLSDDLIGTTRVQRIKAILGETGVTTVDCLKIDIEGHEERALPPYIDECADHELPKAIVVERGPHGAEYPRCSKSLGGRGFKLAGASRNNHFYRLQS